MRNWVNPTLFTGIFVDSIDSMVYWGYHCESSWMLMSMGWFSRQILQGNSDEFHGKICQNRCPWLDFPDTNALGTCLHGTTRWCPQTIAKLVQITPISLWFIGDISN